MLITFIIIIIFFPKKNKMCKCSQRRRKLMSDISLRFAEEKRGEGRQRQCGCAKTRLLLSARNQRLTSLERTYPNIPSHPSGQERGP